MSQWMNFLKISSALALASFVLAGCQSAPVATKKYKTIAVPEFRNTVPLSRHFTRVGSAVEIRYLEPSEFKAAMIDQLGQSHYEWLVKDYTARNITLGFAVGTPEGECHVYMERRPVDVNDSSWFYTFGHELFHCVMPNFH